MCQEFVTFWYGELYSQWAARKLPSPTGNFKLMDEIAIRCGNQQTVVKKCFKARFFGKCANPVKSVAKFKTLCPQCLATSHDDPFYLIHLKPTHRMYAPPASIPASPKFAPDIITTSHGTQYSAPTCPSATHQQQHLPSGSYALTQPTYPTTQQTQQYGRSLTNPGLQRSPAVRRPRSRGQSSSAPTQTGIRHTRTTPSGSYY